MPYGTPVTHPFATYTAQFRNDLTEAGATLEVKMYEGEGTSTEAGLDSLFQKVLDLLDGASFLVHLPEANKHQATNTTVTPTP